MKKAKSILLAIFLSAAPCAAYAELAELWIEDAPRGLLAESLAASEIRAGSLLLSPAEDGGRPEPSGELLAKFVPEEMTGVVTAELYFAGRYSLSSSAGEKMIPARSPVFAVPPMPAGDAAPAKEMLAIFVPAPESEGAEERAAACAPGEGAAVEFPFDVPLPSTVDIYIVSFREERRTYEITAESGDGGAIVPRRAEVPAGGDAVFQILAKDEWLIADLRINGRPLKNAAEWRGRGSFAYELKDVSGDMKISAAFERASVPTYFITVIQGDDGTITPSGSVTVPEGEEQGFTVAAADGFVIEELLVNGAPVAEAAGQSVYSYVFPGVDSNGQTISASFAGAPQGRDADGGAEENAAAEISGCSAASYAAVPAALLPAVVLYAGRSFYRERRRGPKA